MNSLPESTSYPINSDLRDAPMILSSNMFFK